MRILASAVAALALTTVAAVALEPVAQARTTVASATGCGTQVGAAPLPGQWEHLTLVLFENKPLRKVIGSRDAPYLTSLATECSYATNMHHLTTTSLTNYIGLTSGYTGHNGGQEQLITSTKVPRVWPQDSVSIFEAMGADAREWAEDMPRSCYLRNSGDLFEAGHTPYQYYTRTQKTLCPLYALPLAGNDPMSAKFNLVIPNRPHIMHGTLTPTTSAERTRIGDTWASTFVPGLLASAEYRAGRSAVIIAFDEASSTTSVIPFIVISPYTASGGTTAVSYNHYSTLAGIQQMLGVTPLLGHAADAGVASIAQDSVFGLG